MMKSKFAVWMLLLQLIVPFTKAKNMKVSSQDNLSFKSNKTQKSTKKKELKNQIESEDYCEYLPYFGLWGSHEILSLCGGNSWWKYPSYLSVFKNLGRLFSTEKVEDLSLEAQVNEYNKQEEENEKKQIEETFGPGADVENIKGKIKKFQKKYKKRFEQKKKKIVKIQKLFRKHKYGDGYENEYVRNFRIENLAKLDGYPELWELRGAMNNLAIKFGEVGKRDVISGIIDAVSVGINNKIIDIENLKNQFNSRYKKEYPEDSYGIYGVVNVDKNIVKTVLLKNVKAVKKNGIKYPGILDNAFEELKKHIDNNRLKFFLIFSSASDCRGKLMVSLMCCRNLSFADKFIRSEAKNVKDPSGTSPFWGMFMGPNNGTFLECNINEIKNDEDENGGNESDESSENEDNEDEDEDDEEENEEDEDSNSEGSEIDEEE